jgi:hypothetical protein
MPISEVCSNPSRVSRRARRFVPLLGMELATILIRYSSDLSEVMAVFRVFLSYRGA